MSAAEPTMDGKRLLEVRVLEGELKGARMVVDCRDERTLGGELGHDVVLRGGELGERRVAFKACDAGVHLRMLRGDASASGRLLQEGDELDLPLYGLVRLGKAVIAFGRQDAAEWNAGAGKASKADSGKPAEAADARSERLRWPLRLVAAGTVLAIASMGALAFAFAASPAAPGVAQHAAKVQAALRAAGFDTIVVRTDADRTLVASGHLETSAQRAQVERLLAAQPVPVRLVVSTSEQVKAAVLEVFRLHGIAADASIDVRGAVSVTASVADAAKLERIEAIVRRDVAGLAALVVRNTPPQQAPDSAPVADDPGKRVASILPGDPAYVVTADGTRYFEGAVLPSGHRIASIRTREVHLQRGGASTTLRF